MDKEKQIEEMAKIFCEKCKRFRKSKSCFYSGYPEDEECCFNENYKTCKLLFKKGYRKIPEDSVVLTEEESERFRGQTINIAKIKAQERKKTTEKILNKIYKIIKLRKDGILTMDDLTELAKQHEVEIKE